MPQLPSKIRTGFPSMQSRIKPTEWIFKHIRLVPEEWLGAPAATSSDDENNMECLPCTKYEDALVAWRTAMKWTFGLDCALSVMLSSITSTNTLGDQLWVKVMGPASCIAGDAFIGYVVMSKDGKLRNKKGGPLRRLYERFHGVAQRCAGPRWEKDSDYFIQSVNEEGYIVRNKVQDVIDNGVKDVYTVVTLSGKTVDATSDHEFLTEYGYKQLSEIRVGDKLYVNHGKTQKKGRKKPPYRKEDLVKYHPNATVKVVNGCTYYRKYAYQLMFEANENKMTYKEYVHVLNNASQTEINKLWTIPDGYEVHHKDGDAQNNSLDNLGLVASSSEHHKLYHASDDTKSLAIYAELDEVVAIRAAGKKHVYDIVCSDPYRNFVAGGIVVHNCGKSTLCEAVSVARQYVYAKSTIRGFHSGYKTDKAGEKDHSMIEKTRGKTLITKDGDTLLQSPNLSQILSEARDLYDSTSRTHYRHGVDRDYQGVRMTWILCGTSSLRTLDSSELGARFLDCVIMEGIDDEFEDEVLLRVADRADRILSIESGGRAESHQEPNLTAAMQLTGGYINYLRENATRLLAQVEMDTSAKYKCTRLGKFVAFMRARPSKQQEENAEREFAARLVSQHVRLAKCLAAVLNKESVDEDVMHRTRKVAMDTARGVTLEITHFLYKQGKLGAEVRRIWTNSNLASEDKTRNLLRFLRAIGVAEPFTVKTAGLVNTRQKWRLTEKMTKLYAEVMDSQESEE